MESRAIRFQMGSRWNSSRTGIPGNTCLMMAIWALAETPLPGASREPVGTGENRRPFYIHNLENKIEGMRMKHYTKKEWDKMVKQCPSYFGKWEPTPFNLGRIAAGELSAEYIGRRNMMTYEPESGTVLLTEGVHFTIEE